MTVSLPFDRFALLDAIYEGTPDFVAVVDEKGQVIDANRSALAFAECPKSAMSTEPLWNAPGFQRRPALAAWLRRALPLAVQGRAETYAHLDAHDASTRQFAVRAIHVTGVDAPMLQVVALDVSSRDKNELVFAEREQRLRTLTEHTHDLLFTLRCEGDNVFRCESVNAAYLRATGLREDQLIGRTVQDVLPPEQAAIAHARYLETVASHGPITYREVVDVPEGRMVLQTTLTAVRDTQGRATYILGLARDVSGEERALVALRESEARFRAALDAGHDAFVIARAVRSVTGAIEDFVIVDANARAATLVDESLTWLIGKSLLDAFPLSRDTGLWEQCCRVVATRTPFELAQSAPAPTRPGRWVQRQIVPLGDGVAISSRDVTERRREQEALEASEARHRQLFESSGAIQLIVEEQSGAIIDVNPAAQAFYGWPRSTMRSMFITDLDGETLDAWRAYGERATSIAPAKPERHVHRVASGAQCDVEFASSPVVIDSRLARHLIVHDISDRVRAERQLRESEARFRAVINEMSEGVVVQDATGATRAFNPSAERILGLSGAELLGLQPIAHDWQSIHEDGSPWPASEHPAMIALRTGQSQGRAVMGIQRSDRTHTWLSVTADPLQRAEDALPYAAVSVFSDITAQRVADSRLRQAQKIEAVGQLAGGIAHDFNNLLTVIRGATGFLRESLAGDQSALDDVQAIDRAAERAEELTRRLLAIGRRQMLRTESVDLSALMTDQASIIRAELPANVRLVVAPASERVMARLDREQLQAALRALVDNAVAAMKDAGGTLRLSTARRDVERPTSLTERGGVQEFAVLEVADTGIGMTDEVRTRLFEPFFSTQPFGANRGMGLASVHGMVAQSHGFIECDSVVNQGTVLRLFFPLASELERSPTPSGGVAPISAARGILMVDDDPMVRDLGRRLLERLGHQVAVAASGAEALALIESSSGNISLVVTDLTMPGMSGIELIAAIEARFPSLPMVAISGFAMNPSVRHELDARRVPFVGKPFTPEELAQALARALALKTATPATSA